MKDFDALKNIWHGQVDLPKLSYEDIFKGVKSSKNSFANKLLFEAGAISLAIVLFIFIWARGDYAMWTTHLSLLIFIFCCFFYLFVQYKDYKSISNSEFLLQQPEEYIVYLRKYKQKRYTLNTSKYKVYSVFIGLAFGLYFVEVYFTSPLWQTVVGILATVLWFVICWFLMRTYTKREQEKLNEIIGKLQDLETQFTEQDQV